MTNNVELINSPKMEAIEIVKQQLRGLLEYANHHNLVSITGIAQLSDGSYFRFSSETMSRLTEAGALLECAVQRLSDD